MVKNLNITISTLAFLVLTTSTFWIIDSVLNPNKALAWFEVCNRTSKRAYVAFAHYSTEDNRDVQQVRPSGSSWVSEGWWTVNPGQCKEVYPHELWRRNKFYYVYAETDGRTTIWKGNSYFCIGRGTPFKIFQADEQVDSNPPGTVLKGCGGINPNAQRGIDKSLIERVPFDQVEITGRTRNFTYRLTD